MPVNDPFGDARDQHRELLGQARAFLAAIEGGDRTQAGAVVETLEAGIGAHMRDEEESMRRASYPFLRTHAAAHARFLRRFRNLGERYLGGGMTVEVTREAYEVMLALVEEHLETLDSAFEVFMKDREKWRAAYTASLGADLETPRPRAASPFPAGEPPRVPSLAGRQAKRPG